MKKPTEVLRVFEKYTPIVDIEIQRLLGSQDNLLLYDMMRYFFGYLDEDLKNESNYGGKRFRPGLTLLCADFYGKSKDVLGAAAAIEIFHNFTLIHDDIEDNDPIRRGRPTVWKKWGINHGINTGDTQLILAYKELNQYYGDKPEVHTKVNDFLTNVFQGVAEGQYRDFTLAESKMNEPGVNENAYLEMIERKSAILVAASAKVAGIIADVDSNEIQNLWDFGLHLGFAYQLNDDLISIWGKAQNTGKVESKDIEEHKKTLPIIYLYSRLNKKSKVRFASIYDKSGELTHDEISEIKSLLDENEAGEYVLQKISLHLNKANEAIGKLHIKDTQKQLLLDINKALIPDLKWWECK